MILLPASIRTVPRNLATRCQGRRVVGYPHNEMWPDEIIVTRDTVYGYADTLRGAGLEPESDNAAAEAAIRVAKMAWPHACRPDGRLFYTISPETTAERAVRDARIKAETKQFLAMLKSLSARDKRRSSGEIEMF